MNMGKKISTEKQIIKENKKMENNSDNNSSDEEGFIYINKK